MAILDLDVNSLHDLDRQLEKFRLLHPDAKLNEDQVGKARADAQELDNKASRANERVTYHIEYSGA